MMFISKYVHKYNLGNCIAYYHSLRMKPVYLALDEAIELELALKEKREPKLHKGVWSSLKEYLIVVENDDGVVDYVRSFAPKPYVSVAYFVLSEQCNLACRYCFLGNYNRKKTKICDTPMSEEIADKALRFFALQTKQDLQQFNDEKEIIFYGGEPLLNFSVLKFVINRCSYYQNKGLLSKNINFSMVTNGILLDEERIRYLRDNNVSVSISLDGCTAEDNSNRVDGNGFGVYSRIIQKIQMSKKLGLDFGLSITLTENTIKNIDSLISFLLNNDIKSVCFNILMKNKNYSTNEKYYQEATRYIIDFYKKTRYKGIFEERFSRKLKAFVESGIYFSDCAATSGSQIVLTPNGDVGICHGGMENRDYFIGNIIKDSNMLVKDNSEFIHWSKSIPIFKKECESCEALGICGGGCPMNARQLSKDNTIDGIDETFCVHAKDMLRFLIEELYYMQSKVSRT